MRTILLSSIALLLSTTAFSQFALEQTYANAGTPGSNNQLMMVELESLGFRYVFFNKAAKTLEFFDLDHTQVQVIDLAAALDNGNAVMRQVLYITQFLFDLDPGIEVMYVVAGGPGTESATTYIMDESGTIIQAFPNEAGHVRINIPQAHFPIYETPQGAKMILSHQADLSAKVYSLPGHLPAGMIPSGSTPGIAGEVKAYPNPASDAVRFELDPSMDPNALTIRFYSSLGSLVLERRVQGHAFTIERGGLASGTYTYTIASGTSIGSAGCVVFD